LAQCVAVHGSIFYLGIGWVSCSESAAVLGSVRLFGFTPLLDSAPLIQIRTRGTERHQPKNVLHAYVLKRVY